jgi:hypothetical protein
VSVRRQGTGQALVITVAGHLENGLPSTSDPALG